MGKPLASYFLAAGLFIGCGGQLRHLAYPPREDPIPALLLLSHSPDAEKFETVAYAHYIRGDYVRALRYAYRASKAAPEDLHLRLLLGLIYDRGFGRADLALPEYGRVLHLREGLTTRLHPRIHYLYHRLQERRAERALQPDMPPPLAGQPLAVFPFRATGPRPPDPGLRLGLTDLLLYDLQHLTDGGQSDPLSLHILSHTFQRARPGAGPDEYARWIGADRTLTGSLVDLGKHRVRIAVQIFDRNGRSLYEADPVTVDLRDLQGLRHALLSGAIEGLELCLPAALPPLPVASPVTLQLHAEGLSDYVTGQVSKAHERLTGARKWEPQSSLLSRTHGWAALYLEGERGSGIPIHIYMELVKQPDPSQALQRRLQATHSLIVPSPGAQTGSESPHPYKPPRTEGAP